jgi:hypothetical protein
MAFQSLANRVYLASIPLLQYDLQSVKAVRVEVQVPASTDVTVGSRSRVL